MNLRDQIMLTVLPDLLRDARLHRQSAESAVENAWAVADIGITARGPEAEPAAPVATPARKPMVRWLWVYSSGTYSSDHYATSSECAQEHSPHGRAVRFVEDMSHE